MRRRLLGDRALRVALAEKVPLEERNDPFFAQRGAGVPDIQMRIGHPHEDPAAILSCLGSFKDGIGGILDNLENLPIAIAAGEHGLFGIEVFSNKLWFDFVDSEGSAAIGLDIGDKGRIR
jgi:hypothetical protein